MKTSLSLAAAITVAAFLAVCPRSLADKEHTLNDTDSQFVKQAAADGMSEVKLAELAVQKANRADVKDFAQMLIRDHSTANTELSDIAKNKGIDVSAIVAPKTAETFQGLEKESGADFDKAFLKQMESDHSTCVSNFESEAKNVKDGELKTFVDKTLPTLKGHLDMVKQLRAK